MLYLKLEKSSILIEFVNDEKNCFIEFTASGPISHHLIHGFHNSLKDLISVQYPLLFQHVDIIFKIENETQKYENHLNVLEEMYKNKEEIRFADKLNKNHQVQ